MKPFLLHFILCRTSLAAVCCLHLNLKLNESFVRHLIRGFFFDFLLSSKFNDPQNRGTKFNSGFSFSSSMKTDKYHLKFQWMQICDHLSRKNYHNAGAKMKVEKKLFCAEPFFPYLHKSVYFTSNGSRICANHMRASVRAKKIAKQSEIPHTNQFVDLNSSLSKFTNLSVNITTWERDRVAHSFILHSRRCLKRKFFFLFLSSWEISI